MIGLDDEQAAMVSPETHECACPRAALARALDAILGMNSAELGTVLVLAEAQRAGVRAALIAALEAEAVHLAGLSRRAYAAADRLAKEP